MSQSMNKDNVQVTICHLRRWMTNLVDSINNNFTSKAIIKQRKYAMKKEYHLIHEVDSFKEQEFLVAW